MNKQGKCEESDEQNIKVSRIFGINNKQNIEAQKRCEAVKITSLSLES